MLDASEHETASASAGLIDAVRVVPVHAPEAVKIVEPAAAAAAPAPNLVYGDGPLLTAVKVFTVFWGSAWEQQQVGLVGEINAFFDFILTSPLVDQLHEYSKPGKAIGHGSRAGSITIASPAPGHTVTDTRARRFLEHEISTGQLPQPDPNLLYFLYLPPGVTSVMQGRSCQTFCGYHNDVGGNLFYAVMPYPGCAGCRMSLPVIDSLTMVSSHELCEAITDPVPGTGWYDQNYGEIGDICVGQSKKVGQYTVQKEWSNTAGACV